MVRGYLNTFSWSLRKFMSFVIVFKYFHNVIKQFIHVCEK